MEVGKEYLVGTSGWVNRGDLLHVRSCNVLNKEWSNVNDDLKFKLLTGFGNIGLATGNQEANFTCLRVHQAYREAFDEAETDRCNEYLYLYLF